MEIIMLHSKTQILNWFQYASTFLHSNFKEKHFACMTEYNKSKTIDINQSNISPNENQQ